MEKKKTGEPREISIKELFKTFKHGFWIMAVAAIVFAVAAFGYTKIFIPKSYTVYIKFYVESSARNEGSYGDMSSLNYATALVDNYIEMLQSNNFAERLSDNLEKKYSAPQLRRMVSFKNDDESKTMIFNATVQAGSPNDAYTIGKEVETVAPDVVSENSTNAQLRVIDCATFPTAPSGPNAKKNALIAGIAGFILALIFVFIREALDNKVKYSNDMIDVCGVPILAAVPDFGEERILIGKQSAKTDAESEAENNG